MPSWFHGPAEQRPQLLASQLPQRVAVDACFVCGSTQAIELSVDGLTWLCTDPNACETLANRETAGGPDQMDAPLAGASAAYGWEWGNGALVYTHKQDLGPREARLGAVAEEIRDDIREAATTHRRHRWSDLGAEVSEEFAEYSQREHEVCDALERRAVDLNELKRRWVAYNWHKHRLAIYRWRKNNQTATRAIAHRQYRKHKLASRNAGEWSFRCRNCGVEYCPVRTRAMRHCSDACRLQYGRDSEDARLGKKLGLDPASARRSDRRDKRRARGIGPRKTLSVEPGTRVGYWLVVERVHVVRGDAKRFKYRCRCRCGREREIPTRLLIDGAVLSCRSCRHERERSAA